MVSCLGMLTKILSAVFFLAAAICHGVAGTKYADTDISSGISTVDNAIKDIDLAAVHFGLACMILLAAITTLVGACCGGYPYYNKGSAACWFVGYLLIAAMMFGVGGYYKVQDDITSTMDTKMDALSAVRFLFLTSCFVSLIQGICAMVHLFCTCKTTDTCAKVGDVVFFIGALILCIAYGLLFSEWQDAYDLQSGITGGTMTSASSFITGFANLVVGLVSINRYTWNYFAMIGYATVGASELCMVCQDGADDIGKVNSV